MQPNMNTRMNKKFYSHTSSWAFATPWLSAGAVALLTVIIVIFAADNLNRSRRLLTEGLFHKGKNLISFIGAGTRASMMFGMSENNPLQLLIEQTAEAPDIHYIIIMDGSGRILAHNDFKKIGTLTSHVMDNYLNTPPEGEYRILESAENGRKTFEVYSHFKPFPRHRGPVGQGRGRMQHMQKGSGGDWNHNCRKEMSRTFPGNDPDASQGKGISSQSAENGKNGTWCDMFPYTNLNDPERQHIILVGLDMSELDKLISNQRVNIIIISLALFLIGLAGILSLMTAQGWRVSEKTLRQMQAFTALLISRLPVGIIATDRHGRIKTCNATAARMIGREAESVIGKSPSRVLPSDLVSLLNAGTIDEIRNLEIDLTNEQQEYFRLHAGSVGISGHGEEFTGRVLILHDMTEIKNLEQKVKRHDQLVALGKMAAGVAHEVRNPLSSIKGFATLLSEHFKDDDPEHEAAALMVNEVERLNRSISDLLNYARPIPLNKEKTNLKNLVDQTLKLVQTDTQGQDIEIFMDFREDLPEIELDQDRFKQVMLNLLLNAIQAMPNGGRLVLGISYDELANRINLKISDTGCGITEEALDKILDPYFTTKPEGTGLGLAMVNKIVDEHDGSIYFQSTVNKGTTVTVSLPVH